MVRALTDLLPTLTEWEPITVQDTEGYYTVRLERRAAHITATPCYSDGSTELFSSHAGLRGAQFSASLPYEAKHALAVVVGRAYRMSQVTPNQLAPAQYPV